MGEFIIWLLIIVIFLKIVNSFRPEDPPPEPDKPEEPEKESEKPESQPKPEGMTYTDDFKNQIAIESIKGKSDDDIIKEHPTVTAEEINEWKTILVDSIVNLSEQNEKLSAETKKLNSKVERLEEICQIFIGDGWKEKTGYKYM